MNKRAYDNLTLLDFSRPGKSTDNPFIESFNKKLIGNIHSEVHSGVNGFTREYTYNTGKNTLQKIEDSSSTTLESYTYSTVGTWNQTRQLICHKNPMDMGILPL